MAYLNDFHNPDRSARLYIKSFLEITANSLCCNVEDIVKDIRVESAYDGREDYYIFLINLMLCTVNRDRFRILNDTLTIDSQTIRNDSYYTEPNSMTMLLDKISQLIEPRVKELKELNADKIKAKEKADWDATTKTRLTAYIKPSIYKSK